MIAAYLAALYFMIGAVVVVAGAALSRDVRRCLAVTWWLVIPLIVAWPLAFRRKH